MGLVQCELSKTGTGYLRGKSLIQDKYMHVVPTTGGMPDQALVHKYQQRWSDKVKWLKREELNPAGGYCLFLRLLMVQFLMEKQDVKCNNEKKKNKKERTVKRFVTISVQGAFSLREQQKWS